MLMVVRIVIDLVGRFIRLVPAEGIMVQYSGCRSRLGQTHIIFVSLVVLVCSDLSVMTDWTKLNKVYYSLCVLRICCLLTQFLPIVQVKHSCSV